MSTNNQRYVFVLHGLSNSGKTTAQRHLDKEWNVLAYHPMEDYYAWIAKVFFSDERLDEEYVMSQAFKERLIPGTETTALQYLVAQWKLHRDLGVPVTRFLFENNYRWLSRVNFSFGNVRNEHEVDMLIEFAEKTGHKIIWINLESPLGQRRNSDEGAEALQRKFMCEKRIKCDAALVTLVHDGETLPQLHKELDRVVRTYAPGTYAPELFQKPTQHWTTKYEEAD